MAKSPLELRCEYHLNPIGIDATRPRLSWLVSDSRRGAKQVAYQILAASSAEMLKEGKTDLWDTGRVASDQSIHVPYSGKPLASRQRVYWTVRTWVRAAEGKEVASAFAPAGFFETGLLQSGDWSAQWIQSDLCGGKHVPVAVPFFRREFSAGAGGKVVSARLYATALGLYIPSLNGKAVGKDVFAPGWTEYRKRVQYQVYDVTALIRKGSNCIGFALGDGWYAGKVADLPRGTYGDRPRLLAQLEIRYANGTSEVVPTDTTWRFATGPILEADLVQGESYDARREMPGWDTPGFDDANWRRALPFVDPKIAVVANMGTMVRRQEELRPVKISKFRKGWDRDAYIVDLGQNMVGWVRLKVKGEAGQTITLRYSEILDKDGKPYYENLRSARATDYYTLKGDPKGETFEPHFTFHGFRYVEVDRYPGELRADAITGVVVHSDMEEIGDFECSEPLLNQLQSNIRWGQKGNYLEVPTDCPQRDERLGWTGDAQVFVRTGAFNFNVAPFFTKWQQDLADSQGENGGIPPVIPHPSGPGGNGGPAWSDAHIICPWTIYLCYGDTRLLEKHYESLKKWVDSLAKDSAGVIRAHPSKGWGGFGDWLATDNGRENVMGRTPSEIIGTALYAYVTDLLARIATIVGKASDAKKYASLHDKIRKAFARRYITQEGFIHAHTQTAYVLALHFDLVPEAIRPLAAAALVDLIKGNGMHLTTGFVGSPYLNHVLTQTGQLDTAYQLLFQKSWPSWLYAVTQGATTIWERWDGWTHDKGFQTPGMNSFNHYAYGAIGAWLYQVVAGIDADPEKPGYKHSIIRPRLAPEGSPALTHAKASMKTMYGVLSSAWKLNGKRFTLEVTIPANTTATIHVPAASADVVKEGGKPASKSAGLSFVRHEDGKAVFEAAAGTYRFASVV